MNAPGTMSYKPRVAVLGAGMGGLTAAAALSRRGFEVTVYEQAAQFARVGAGIQMSPNAMRVLRGLGLEERIRAVAFRPISWTNREWDSGAMKFELPLGEAAEAQYGAPYLLMHRADLHAALVSAVPKRCLALGRKCVDARRTAGGVALSFSDGSKGEADVLIAADGVHSLVRTLMLGAERPKFTGRTAYRATFPAARLGVPLDACTKWWGEDRHIVIYYVTAARDEVYFVTSLPEPDWTQESWSATGDLAVLRQAFSGFHEQVRRTLDACPQVHKWAIVVRDPLRRWVKDRMALLGDACHPMTPYMAQGAAMAMEDAIVLARCLDGDTDVDRALHRYAATRQERTAKVQLNSHMNTWMRQATDPSWVYGYDAWHVPLADAGAPAPSSSAA
jgi:6-hydroxynicotinate 3-monooxygenase